MNILLFISILLFGSLIFVIYSSKKKYKELEQKLTFKVKDDAKEYFAELEERKKTASKEYQDFLDSLIEKRELNKEILENERKLIEEKLSNFERLETEKRLNEIKQRVQEKEQEAIINCESYISSLSQKGESYKNEIEAIKCELEDLKVKRQTTIEAYKREEERKAQQAFYMVQLSNQDEEDINLLRSIESNIHNKDALNKLIYEVFIKKPLSELLMRIVGNETYSGIYKITNIQNEKSYVGRSTDCKKRITEHIKGSLGISTIADQKIHQEIANVGIKNFAFEILEKVPKEQLSEREKYWISYYNSIEWGYNQNSGG